jgi:hypothetical protein
LIVQSPIQWMLQTLAAMRLTQSRKCRLCKS